MSEGGRFLARWSRLKKATATASTALQNDSPAAAELANGESLLANLDLNSDFTTFLRKEVSEAVRRKAMKTLFADPQFNVIDPLDIYIDDYSIFEPIPDAMMATLQQARMLFDEKEEPEEPETPAEGELVEPVAADDLAAAPAPPAADLTGEGCDILAIDGQNVADAAPVKMPFDEKTDT